MKACLLIFDETQIAHENMIKVVDRMPDIVNCHAVFRNTICLASDLETKAIATKLNERLPTLRYLITEVQPENKGGRMNKSVFRFLNKLHPVEVEPA